MVRKYEISETSQRKDFTTDLKGKINQNSYSVTNNKSNSIQDMHKCILGKRLSKFGQTVCKLASKGPFVWISDFMHH